MNDRIQNKEMNEFLKRLNLPSHLSYQQMQEIALYAAYRLDEQKKKKAAEKIIFNPTVSDAHGMSNLPLKSDANISHTKYKLGNQKKN